jgi:hypothetical protein
VQRVQELTAEKDRIEKLIAYILNGESYSKLNQIVKENVKVVLSENKKLISISFVALIQTIKADPQMGKLIYNIASANDGENKDNKDNNNIIKYFEFNKDKLLHLAEKNYENIMEALTINVMNTAANSSYNSMLSLPQTSSTFLNLSNQCNTSKIEEPESFDNSKGDIAD